MTGGLSEKKALARVSLWLVLIRLIIVVRAMTRVLTELIYMS